MLNKEGNTGKIERIARMLVKSRNTVVFTGSGISAESGVPTFRGRDGLWKKYNPEKVASISGFKKNPDDFWEFARELVIKSEAEPNPAHYALAELEKEGVLKAVITQNIDMLHQRAGSRKVYELHGSLEYVDCLECGEKYRWEEIEECLRLGEGQTGSNQSEGPVCDNCSSKMLKPRIVFFGELLPSDVVAKADQATRECDLFIVVGSSLGVYPAADLPWLAKSHGARMVLINTEPSEQDHLFDVAVYGKAGEILPEVVSGYRRMKKGI